MTSKTHITSALALNMALLLPKEPKTFLIFTASTVIGSIISDIDITTSESHKDLIRIILTTIFLIFLTVILESFFHFRNLPNAY